MTNELAMSDDTFQEKRCFVRVKTFIDVMLKVYSNDWQEITDRVSGVVLNMSKESFFVKMDRLPLVGDRISFLIYSKKRKQQYKIKGMVFQLREAGAVIVASEIDPPDIVVNGFRSDNGR